MISILVVTHGNLAESLITSLEMIVGEQEGIKGVCFYPEKEFDQFKRDVAKAIDASDTGEGVLVLTDIFGGTPTEVCVSLVTKHKIEILTGVNLLMLIKASFLRKSLSLTSLAEQVEIAGKNGIVNAGSFLCKT